MPVPKRKMSRSKTRSRRSMWKTTAAALANCPQCQQPKLQHTACPTCGTYNRRQVIDIWSKACSVLWSHEGSRRWGWSATPWVSFNSSFICLWKWFIVNQWAIRVSRRFSSWTRCYRRALPSLSRFRWKSALSTALWHSKYASAGRYRSHARTR